MVIALDGFVVVVLTVVGLAVVGAGVGDVDGCLVVDGLLLAIVSIDDPSAVSLSSGMGTIVFPYNSKFR